MIVAARSLLLDAQTWIDGGGLLVEGGVVRRVLRSRRAVQRARASRSSLVEHEGLLTPGLVNAHAHLELGGMHRRIRARNFWTWIEALLLLRTKLTRRDFEQAVREGARTSLAGGTTTIGDIDSSGASARLAPKLLPRWVVYTEVLDVWDPGRTRAALSRARAAARARPAVLWRRGVSPHAPYSTSNSLLEGVAALARGRALPITVHWAETREEGRWLRHGSGPFARILQTSPRRSGLELLAAAGVLGKHTSLVHGNYPHPSDLELLARRRVTVVHCPGTHAFFARPRFALQRYRSAGVPIALGTDSLASNDALDLRREMALLRGTHPRLEPAEVFSMSTTAAARALGLAGVGHLRAGAEADMSAWDAAPQTHSEALEVLTAGVPRVRWVRVRGRLAGHSRQ